MENTINSKIEENQITNVSETSKENNRNEIEEAFFADKASFVGGIALIIAMILDIVGLFHEIPDWCSILSGIIVVLIFGLFLATPWMDQAFRNIKGFIKCSRFLTIMSGFVFAFEKIFLPLSKTDVVLTVIIILIFGFIITMSIYLFVVLCVGKKKKRIDNKE